MVECARAVCLDHFEVEVSELDSSSIVVAKIDRRRLGKLALFN